MGNARILVIEEENLETLALQDRLRHLGYHVSGVVPNGQDALAKAAESRPDLILMDLPVLSQSDGVETARELQQRLGIPVVCLTCVDGETDWDLARRRMPLEFLPKPFHERDLRGAIEAALQRHAMESKLEESQEWFFTTLRSIGDAVVASDESGRITFLNPKAEALTGWTQSEACGRPLAEVLRIEGRRLKDSGEGAMGALIRNEIDLGLGSPLLTVISRDDRKIPVEANASLIREDSGRVLGVVRILRDITERRQSEEILRGSEHRYRSLVEKSQDIIFTMSSEGIITSLNPAFEKTTGWPRRDWLMRPFSQLLRPEDRESAWKAFRRVLAGEELAPLEMRARSRSGAEIVLECACAPTAQEGPDGVWGVARDITQRKRLEERVLETQKMEAVGRMAGGIAHDFNNLLTAITGYTDFLNQALGKDSPLLHNVEGILSSVDRAANLTRQLLAFSRKQVASPRSLDLNGVIAGVLPTLGGLVDEHIDLSLELGEDLGAILADPAQLEQVLLILAANARDAMPERGRLSIVTSEELTPPEKAVEAPFPVPYVLLTVSDTGSGMTEEVKARLFEPFFTTKPIGRGMGLGLSTVYGIVKLGGGDIQVRSEPGLGTSFHLYFPRIEPSQSPQPAPQPAGESRQGGETILLVEDDEEVRSLLSTILKSERYSVLQAKDGEQALEMADAHQGGIHLTVTDIHMPKMGGRQLVERLLLRSPQMKVLFMSGFSREDFPEKQYQTLPVCFLEKPFMPKSLIRQIRRILDG